MENNLDDILVDNPENNENKGTESKRKILIGIASGLLIAVVILAIYFVFAKESQPQGLEVTHDELERFINPIDEEEKSNPQDEVSPKAKDDFDQLIADIKSKQIKDEIQNTQPQTQSVDMTQRLNEAVVMQTKKQVEPALQVQNPQIPQPMQEEVKPPVKATQPTTKTESKQDTKSKPVQQPKIKQAQQTQKTNNQTKSASETFGASEMKIPKGFYLQVGVFGGKPNVDFLNKIAKFPYKIEKLDRRGKVVNRYLIGGFKSRSEAESKINEVAQKIAKPILIEIP